MASSAGSDTPGIYCDIPAILPCTGGDPYIVCGIRGPKFPENPEN
jgi:hypothetical protein